MLKILKEMSRSFVTAEPLKATVASSVSHD